MLATQKKVMGFFLMHECVAQGLCVALHVQGAFSNRFFPTVFTAATSREARTKSSELGGEKVCRPSSFCYAFDVPGAGVCFF